MYSYAVDEYALIVGNIGMKALGVFIRMQKHYF